MTEYVLPLDSPRATVELAGGKGNGLSILQRGGFRVPDGFIITTGAYESFVAAGELMNPIIKQVSSAPDGRASDLDKAATMIRGLFERAAIPGPVLSAIEEALGRLPQGEGVAVRSSATAEDLPGASFAGQHDTYLGIHDRKSILGSVKRCWSSLWSARAMAYRLRRGIDARAVSMAVVIQRMIPSDSAGVLFTANPLTGNQDESHINAAWGLGETVVSGRVAPDYLVIDKASGRVKQIEVGDKSVMQVPTGTGVADVTVGTERRRQPVLTPGQVADLNRIGSAIETLRGGPQDIEWALHGGATWILQSRPVTGPVISDDGVPGDDDWPYIGRRPAQPFDLWTQANVGEVWPEPVTPLSNYALPAMLNGVMSYAMPTLRTLHETQWVKRHFGRVYYNEGALVHLYNEILGLPFTLLDTSFGGRAAGLRSGPGRIRPLRLLRVVPHMISAGRIQTRSLRELPVLMLRIDEWVSEFLKRDTDKMTDRELQETLQVWIERAFHTLNVYATASGTAMASFGIMKGILRRWCGKDLPAQDLITGLSGIVSAEMAPALHLMATTLQRLSLDEIVTGLSPEEALEQLRGMPSAEPVIRMLERFLDRFGHRGPGEGEYMHPRWIEVPERVIEVVAGYLRSAEPYDPEQTLARLRARREETIRRVEAEIGPIRRFLFRKMLEVVQYRVRLRENGKNCLVRIGLPACLIFRVWSRRWAARGWILKPEDFFFLTLPEIERIIDAGGPSGSGLELSSLIDARRQAYTFWYDAVAPDIVGADGKAVPLPEGRRGILAGLPACGGTARGIARVIHDAGRAVSLQKGDILVTRSTDTGWTPVFPLVSGLVLEIGGQLSHGAIVAREYGIPAVVNVRDAMSRIPDGEPIVVDGTSGTVSLRGSS